MLQVYKLCVKPDICPSGCSNEGAWANRVPGPGSDGRSCGGELREGGSWVVDVAVWVLETIEGGTLVHGQWDTVLDAQWQVRLE